MEALSKQKIVRNRNSILKSLDGYFDLRAEDVRGENGAKVGELRVVAFLEDLGTLELFKEAEERIDREILEKVVREEEKEEDGPESTGSSQQNAPGGVALNSRGEQ